MQTKLNDLKKEFTLLVIIKNDINELLNSLTIRVKKLKDIYDEIIRSNLSSNSIFGLDSFKFQSRLMDTENEDLCRLYKMISNKMYCEYYKLYKMIVQYIESVFKNTKLAYLSKTNDFPIYKDLEPYKEYDFVIIQNMHETILTVLLGIYDLVLNNKEELKLLKNKREFGLSIDNYINSFQYDIDKITNQIKLFCEYITFFHKSQLKYLKRIHTKMRFFSEQINNDIKFDDNMEDTYKCDMDKNTIESVKSMIYENEIIDFTNIISCNSSDSEYKYDEDIFQYENEKKVRVNEMVEKVAEELEKVIDLVPEIMEKVEIEPVEPVAEPTIEQTIEPVIEQTAEAEPVIETVIEQTAEAEPVIEPVNETVIEQTAEAEPVIETVETAEAEPLIEEEVVEIEMEHVKVSDLVQPKKRGRPRKL